MPEGPNLETQHSNEEMKRFILHKDARGTAGVLIDYPNAAEVLAQITENLDTFIKKESQRRYDNRRVKFFLTLNLTTGPRFFMVKGKFPNKFMDTFYPHSPDFSFSRRHSELENSVYNELIVMKEAQRRYKAEYHEDLPTEVPVGFYISNQEEHRGERWVIFEKVENEVDVSSSDLTKRANDFADNVSRRLSALGISTGLGFSTKDVLYVGDSNDPDNLKFILVDSEEWSFYKDMPPKKI